MRPHILIVDDELPIQIMVRAILQRTERFEVSAASGGEEALRLCKAQPIDLVLMDAMMPGMDGFTACERIKTDTSMAQLRVVMCTALAQQADRARGLKAGADAYLTKPFMPHQLVEVINKVLAQEPKAPAA